jgi:hypothetical protein
MKIVIGRRWWVVSHGFISYPRYCHRSAADLLVILHRANPERTYRIIRAWTDRTASKAADGMERDR